jgi:hypothetical protein
VSVFVSICMVKSGEVWYSCMVQYGDVWYVSVVRWFYFVREGESRERLRGGVDRGE